MSYHGLSGATEELKSAVRKCSIAFKEFHGVGATLRCDNIEETVDFIKQKHPDIKLQIIEKFSKMKFHQRIRVSCLMLIFFYVIPMIINITGYE